jgi:hypothetical protein
MNTSRTARIASIIEKRRPMTQKIEGIEANSKSLASGLRNVEIPDGNRQHLTGVRSTIDHNPSVETHGEVWFHSARSFPCYVY